MSDASRVATTDHVPADELTLLDLLVPLARRWRSLVPAEGRRRIMRLNDVGSAPCVLSRTRPSVGAADDCKEGHRGSNDSRTDSSDGP